VVDTESFVSGAVDESEPPARRGFSEIALEGVLLLPNTVKLVARLVRDPRVSVRRKVPLAIAFVYVVSPIDIIPDSILGLGLLGDVVVVSFAVDGLVSNTDPDIVLEHWDGSIDALDLASSLIRWGVTLIPGRR
jgi:uncharacterized membrane protein YkvA (DUF1232 family)